MSVTERPWARGCTLMTPQTARWTNKEIAANENEERRRIFAHFRSSDMGKSRVLVCSLPLGSDMEGNAGLIVKAANSHEELLAMLEEWLDSEEREECVHRPGRSWQCLVCRTKAAIKKAKEKP